MTPSYDISHCSSCLMMHMYFLSDKTTPFNPICIVYIAHHENKTIHVSFISNYIVKTQLKIDSLSNPQTPNKQTNKKTQEMFNITNIPTIDINSLMSWKN